MAQVVVLTQNGIEANSNKYFFQVLGDPSQGPGLKAAVGSIAMQDDSAPKGQLWEKTTASDTGWVLIISAASAGASSSSGAYRASAYNVPVDGSDATTAWTALLSTIPASGGPYTVVLGPTEVLSFANDVTIPARVRIQGFGGVIKPTSGKKVTLMTQPDAVGKLFDTSLGGTVVAGAPMTVRPEWWGAWASGAADSSVDSPSSIAAFKAIVPTGGTLELSQKYQVASNLDVSGIDHSNITIEGIGGTGAGFYHPSDSADLNTSLLFVQGATANGVKNFTIRGVTFSGNSATDYQKLCYVGNVDGFTADRVRLLNNGKEGLYFPNATAAKNVKITDCFASGVGMGVQKLAAFNTNAHNVELVNSKAVGCGLFVEHTGSNLRLIGNHSENSAFAHMSIFSTYSADSNGGLGPETDYNTAICSGNLLLGGGVAFQMNDSSGHTDHGVPVHGNAGKVLITANVANGTAGFFNGGADLLNEIVIQGNYIEDAPNGNNPAISIARGRILLKGNTFKLGVTSGWSYIARIGDTDPLKAAGTVEGNTIVGAAWTTAAFLVGPEVVLSRNIFEAPPTGGGAVRYRFAGSNFVTDGPVSSWIPGTDAWLPQQDADFFYAPSQSSRIKVLGAVPAKGTWQVGDRVDNVATSGPPGWICTTGGTSDTLLGTVTISTTSGSAAFTVTAGTSFVFRYQWVTVAGVTGAKQLATYDPSTGIGTFQQTSNATVTSGAAAFAPPAWTATNNAATLSIASQAAGDTLYALSASAFARLPKGLDGAEYTLVGGVPAWVTAWPRAANVNSGAGLTVTWTPQFNEQQFTSNTATPAYAIAGIPNGGYLVMAHTQDATGGRLPTFTTALTGGLVWAGGSANTTWSAATKTDIVIFHNVGTRVEVWLGPQNI